MRPFENTTGLLPQKRNRGFCFARQDGGEQGTEGAAKKNV